MVNKKLFKSGVLITVVMLSVSGCAGGCSKQAEPVIAESTEETPEPEESIPEESLEPTPSPTVEPEESISEESSESEEEIPSEEVEPEESEPDLGYEIIPIDEVTMYATTNCNLRGGPGTQYDKVGSLSYAQEIVCNGKVEDGDKLWLVLKTDDGSTQMVSGSLVSRDKPVQQSKPSGNTGTGGGSSSQQPSGGNGGGQPSGGTGGSGGGGGSSQPSGGGESTGGVGGGALSGLGLQEAGGAGGNGQATGGWTVTGE